MKALRILLLCSIAVLVMAGKVWALPLPPDYELYTGPVVGDLADEDNLLPAATQDEKMYIWADSENRASWHMRWVGTGTAADWNVYRGFISVLSEPQNTLYSETYTFENHDGNTDSVDYTVTTQDDPINQTGGDTGNPVGDVIFIDWLVKADTRTDGLDFKFEDPMYYPSYLLFTIGNGIDIDLANIIIGDPDGDGDFGNPASSTFAIAAPVPEPATLLLVGIGMLGLAGYMRRRVF